MWPFVVQITSLLHQLSYNTMFRQSAPFIKLLLSNHSAGNFSVIALRTVSAFNFCFDFALLCFSLEKQFITFYVASMLS